MLYSLSRKEGWRRYVDAPARQRPEPLTAAQLKRLGGAAREEYDEARHDWHANFGILRTPQLAAVHGELEVIVTAGRCDPDRVRGGHDDLQLVMHGGQLRGAQDPEVGVPVVPGLVIVLAGPAAERCQLPGGQRLGPLADRRVHVAAPAFLARQAVWRPGHSRISNASA